MKTEFYIEGYPVDLDNDVIIPLTFTIADIKEPEKKQTAFSKTIELPGTTNNNKLFGYLFDTSMSVNSSGGIQYSLGFDPNLKSEVVIKYDGADIFRGQLELNRIKKVNDLQVRYEVTCVGNLINLFFEIGEDYLSDIPLDEYNHPYTYDVQKASWNNYIYYNSGTQAFQYGEGYVYPMIDYGTNNDVDYYVPDWKPAIAARTILKKIFNSKGFSWTSSFFDSAFFKRLYIPYCQGNLRLSTSQINNRTFRASSTSDEYCFSSGTNSTVQLLFQDDSTGLNHDAGNVYNTGTSEFTVSKAGSYKIIAHANVSVTHFPALASANWAYNSFGHGYLNIKLTPASGAPATLIASVQVRWSPSSSYFLSNYFNVDGGAVTGSTVTSGTTGPISTGELSTTINLQPGDIVTAYFQDKTAAAPDENIYNDGTSSAGATSYCRFNFLTGSYFTALMADPSIHEGDTVEMSSVLPKIKQRDFVTSIFKLFNIYVDQDKSNPYNILAEPRDDFYTSSGVIRDWTYKLDLSKPIDIIPMGDLDAKSYKFTYKEDQDYYNKIDKETYGEVYGTKTYNIENDHRKNQKVIEVIFSPTPLADRNNTDRIISRIFDVNSQGAIVPKTGNIRLLYYGGVKPTNYAYNYIASSGTHVETTYPYMGHLDDVSNPTIDLNFSMDDKTVYYTATSYTDGNLVNRYYKRFIDEISDKDSKIFKGYFRLFPEDINHLDFRDRFYFERDFYRLLRINDYSPADEKLVQCEFIKIKEGQPFEASSGTISGGINDPIGIDTPPMRSERKASGGNVFTKTTQNVSGRFNIIDPSARGVNIAGDYNYVGANCERVNITASSGISVLAGVFDVNVFNSSGLTIDGRYSGQTIFRNKPLGYSDSEVKTDSVTGASSDYGKTFFFSISANKTYSMPAATSFNSIDGFVVTIKCVTSPYKVDCTISDAGVTFDDSSTTYTVTSGNTKTFTYINGVWYTT